MVSQPFLFVMSDAELALNQRDSMNGISSALGAQSLPNPYQRAVKAPQFLRGFFHPCRIIPSGIAEWGLTPPEVRPPPSAPEAKKLGARTSQKPI